MSPDRPEQAADRVLQEKVRVLPLEPGVYLFRDARGSVLYVGKAQQLRTRVRCYFSAGGDGRYQVAFLVPRIKDIEVVVTSNVKEALLLENQLIKQHKPRFNVRLRDDKNYLGLRLDPTQRYPCFREIRRFRDDKATYFGPYTSSHALRQTLRQLQKLFPLRTCSDALLQSYRRQGRPCLEHSLGRCCAPCCDRVAPTEYARLVEAAVLFLRGKTGDLLTDLSAQMQEEAGLEHFEQAARLRDRMAAIEQTVETRSMISSCPRDQDIFGMAREGTELEIQVMHVRLGQLTGGSRHGFRNVRIEDAEALGSFLSQFYTQGRDLPREMLVPLAVESAEALEEIWKERTGRSVRIRVPKRGERRRLLDLAQHNAEIARVQRSRQERRMEETLVELQQRLRLNSSPERIECYDISHLQGQLHVASRVVFVHGEPYKEGYRRYKLRSTPPGDDYAAMREVLGRRLRRLDQDPAPDLLLLDGGKGQLGAVTAVMRDLGIEPVGVAALAKERAAGEGTEPRVQRHGGSKREKLFVAGVKDPLRITPDSAALLLLQRIRDESHRFAIRYHRELRRKAGLRSILEELPGIGPAKRRALLRQFGSLEGVKAAAVADLSGVARVSREDAERIHDFFHSVEPEGRVKRGSEGTDPCEKGDG